MPEPVAGAPAASPTAKPVVPAKVEPAEPDTDLEASDDDLDSEEIPKGELHKSKRWQKVHGEWKEFSSFKMSPLELQAALVRLQQHETAAAKAREAEGSTAEDKDLAAKRKSARTELSKINPDIDKIKGLSEKADILFGSLERRAERETKVLMTEAGLATGAKNVESMTDVLAGIIADDIELYDDYVTNPKEAVREAFKRFKSGFEAAAARAAKASTQRDKTKLLGLPKTHKAGGTAEVVAKNRVEGPKDLNAARKSAEARLAALEE
jgi:hypothetical protein